MTMQMPQKLSKSPLLEAIFEVRFEPSAPAAGDILPGLLYASMKDEYPEVSALARASVPRELREGTPVLRYTASHRLSGELKTVNIGDRVVSLNAVKYPGWSRFREMVETLLKAVSGTELVKRIERFSFKYVNLIEASQDQRQLPLLNLQVTLMGIVPIERGFRLRAENDEGKCTTIIQISPNGRARIHTAEEVFGLIVEVDTIMVELGDDFLTNPAPLLEEAHMVAKHTFFSLLTEDTLRKMGPQ